MEIVQNPKPEDPLAPFFCDLVTNILQSLPLLHQTRRLNRYSKHYLPKLSSLNNHHVLMTMGGDLSYERIEELISDLRTPKPNDINSLDFLDDLIPRLIGFNTMLENTAYAPDETLASMPIGLDISLKKEIEEWEEMASKWDTFCGILFYAFETNATCSPDEWKWKKGGSAKAIKYMAQNFPDNFWQLFLQYAASPNKDAAMDPLCEKVVPYCQKLITERKLQSTIQEFIDPIMTDFDQMSKLKQTRFMSIVTEKLGLKLPGEFSSAATSGRPTRKRPAGGP